MCETCWPRWRAVWSLNELQVREVFGVFVRASFGVALHAAVGSDHGVLTRVLNVGSHMIYRLGLTSHSTFLLLLPSGWRSFVSQTHSVLIHGSFYRDFSQVLLCSFPLLKFVFICLIKQGMICCLVPVHLSADAVSSLLFWFYKKLKACRESPTPLWFPDSNFSSVRLKFEEGCGRSVKQFLINVRVRSV